MENPYQSQALDSRRMFYGRSSELVRIHSRISAERPQSVSVVGPTGSGKSSLVSYLCDPVTQAEYLDDPTQYVTVVLRLRQQTPATPEAFFQSLAETLAAAGYEGMPASYDGFHDVVRQLAGDGRKLMIFLDDFGEVTCNPGFGLEFFSFMRSVANANDVGYLTTSSAPLQSLCHTQDIEESPFFNIFTTVNLGPLSSKEARQLVEEPAAQAGAPFGDELDWILELAGGQPFLLQATARAAFEARTGGQVSQDALADLAFDATQKFLEEFWADLSEPQRQVLAAVQADKSIEPRQRYAAEELVQRGVLQSNGELGFGAALFCRYVAEANRGKGFFRRLFG